jgi:alpha-amylase/alpha-mannosidase (GH57 family)
MSSFPLYVAFIWHQHQPIYKNFATGKYRLPWVRLHGTKDYLDLMLQLAKFPQLHQNVNLSPSLISQIQDYVDGSAFDPYLELTLTPVRQLSRSQRLFIIERFFDANHRHMVFPYPRYAELWHQREQYGIAWCLGNWHEQDYDDLLAWHNLVWFSPLAKASDPEIQAWFAKGRDFSLSDRQRIYSKQKAILGQIMPQYAKMHASGQVEITTSPYAHPIMPLIADTKSARVADPQMLLPGIRFRREYDLELHLNKAKEIYCEYFQIQPAGLWTPEHGVSPAILPLAAKHQFKWMCADEGVLGWSLGHYFRRDQWGMVSAPNLLYQPYRLETVYGDLAIVFRDRRLSDLIGFSYASMSADAASDDLCQQLLAIHAQQQKEPENGSERQPWLVTIALDGENCWEFYEHNGQDFLEALYAKLAKTEALKLVTVPEYLARFPPSDQIPPHQLHSGSWVDANFSTWIGDPVKNRAWELLDAARQRLDQHPEATWHNNPEAWQSLLAAEGSDWFWWLGEGHSSSQDHIFDQLFREHLQLLYRAINEPIPPGLLYPLEPHTPPINQQPGSLIHPAIDGYASDQEWESAGYIDIAARGTMQKSKILQRLWYGFDHFNFYLRLDFAEPKPLPLPIVHLFWFYPGKKHYNNPISLLDLPDIAPLNYLFHHHCGIDPSGRSVWLEEAAADGWKNISSQVRMEFNQCLELALPWSDLTADPASLARLVIVTSMGGKFQVALPEYTVIPIEVP